MPIEKIKAKLTQTTQYFREVALERMPDAYDLMREEIKDVHTYLHAQGDAFDVMDKWPEREKKEEEKIQ